MTGSVPGEGLDDELRDANLRQQRITPRYTGRISKRFGAVSCPHHANLQRFTTLAAVAGTASVNGAAEGDAGMRKIAVSNGDSLIGIIALVQSAEPLHDTPPGSASMC